MNSHERRTTERRWPHCVFVNNILAEECFPWMEENFGSSSFGNSKRDKMIKIFKDDSCSDNYDGNSDPDSTDGCDPD